MVGSPSPLLLQKEKFTSSAPYQCGRKVRNIWDLRWHGENRAIADPTQDEALHRRGLCGHPSCGFGHIICACPHTTHARASARSDLWYFATRQTPASASCLMQTFVQLLFKHPNLDQRGQLWLGHCPPPLRQELAPHLQGLTLRDGQAILTRIGRRASEAFRDLWDTYGEALALAQPPPSEPDFFLDPPLPNPPSPPPLMAARP